MIKTLWALIHQIITQRQSLERIGETLKRLEEKMNNLAAQGAALDQLDSDINKADEELKAR